MNNRITLFLIDRKSRIYAVLTASLFAASFTGCLKSTDAQTLLNSKLSGDHEKKSSDWDDDDTESDVDSDKPRSYQTGALVFNGTGTATSDTQSVLSILDSHRLTYRVVDSSQLNTLNSDELKKFGVIIWPGGTAKTMSDSLNSGTLQRVRQAVLEEGVGYVGFCAGTFIAGSYGSGSQAWGLNLVNFDFPYYYLENQGVTKAIVNVSLADGTQRDLIWYGGPELDRFGNIIAKYPDGTTAIAQEQIGEGMVTLSGPHPEAPESWKSGLNDSDGSDYDLAWQLIESSLKNQPLQTF